jgi:ABC-type phosphate transport system substrate-binding protein
MFLLSTCLMFISTLFELPPDARIDVEPFAVIVAADVDTARLTRDDTAAIFRRKQTFWKDGHRIQPVNLPAANSLRRVFSQCVLGQLPDATEDYWRQMYFQGVLPPRVLESEQAVSLFVATTPGGVGYVSRCTNDSRLIVVLTFGDAPNCPKRPAVCVRLQDS